MLTVKEAKNQRNNIDIEGKVTSMAERRSVNTKYGPTEVCDAYLEDATGERIKLSLWGKDIDKVEDGCRVSIKGAYTSTYRNEIQLSIPKGSGSITRI